MVDKDITAREFALRTLRSADKERIAKVMLRYMSTFWTKKKKENIVDIAKDLFDVKPTIK